MKRRIVNIASYETPTLRKKLKSAAAFLLTSVLLLGLSPFVSTYAAEETHYCWNTASQVQKYLHEIDYGNENLSGDFSSYWLENSLKISPKEQVELLTKLQNNSLGFAQENVKAVKDAIHISSSDFGNLYGKTGTGRVNGKDINGWFIGFVEKTDNTYFFATNIHAANHADGNAASKITMSILSAMNIWG